MVRTLLPVFSEFKVANGVNAKEEPETFQRMNQDVRGDYEKAKEIQDKIGILKHHYAFPDRWFDGPGGSSLFGSPENIRGDLLYEMTKIYSDYNSHLISVLEAYKVYLLWYNNRKDVTRSEAAELEAWASMVRCRLFDPPQLKESEHTKEAVDKIARSRASYLTRIVS